MPTALLLTVSNQLSNELILFSVLIIRWISVDWCENLGILST